MAVSLLGLLSENSTDLGAQTTDTYFSQFWRLESKIQVPVDLVPGETLFTAWRWLSSFCGHM